MSNSDKNGYTILEKGQDYHKHNESGKVSKEEST